MALSQQQFRKLFTKALMAVYRERPLVYGFMRSFFQDSINFTKDISIEVERGNEKVAIDVPRQGRDGNYNESTKMTEAIIRPPLYWEIVNATDHRLYEVAIGQRSETALVQLAREIAIDVAKARDKIERAYEVQASEVLLDGIVTLKHGGTIDYQRKAGSKVDHAATSNPWTTNTKDPLEDLEAAGDFLRQTGKDQGGVYNVIMGNEAFNAFLDNDKVQAKADTRRFQIIEVNPAQQNAVGAVPQMQVQAGSYQFRVWTYPEGYQNSQGNWTHYMNPKKFVAVPETPRFNMAFGAVPQLLNDDGSIPQSGAYLQFEHMDQRSATHEIHQKSAGIAVPVAVDQMYTGKVIS